MGSTHSELLEEAVYYSRLEILESGRLGDGKFCDYVIFRMGNCMDEGMSDETVKKIVEKAWDEAFHDFTCRILAEERRKLTKDEWKIK